MTNFKMCGLLLVCLTVAAQTVTRAKFGPIQESKAQEALTEEGADVDTMRVQYAEEEAKVAELAAKVAEDSSPKARQQLKAAVERSFTAHTFLQRHRIQEARKRLDLAEQRVQRRQERSESILKSRVERLLAGNSVQVPASKPSGGQVRNEVKAGPAAEIVFIITEAIVDLGDDIKLREEQFEKLMRGLRTLPSEDPYAGRVAAFASESTKLELEENAVRARRAVASQCLKDLEVLMKKNEPGKVRTFVKTVTRAMADTFGDQPASMSYTYQAAMGAPTATDLGIQLRVQLGAIDIRLESLSQQREKLQREILAASEQSRQLNADRIRYDNHKAEITRKKEMYRLLLQKLKDIKLEEARTR